MNIHFDNAKRSKLEMLQQSLIERPDETELLQSCFDEAVAAKDFESARALFDKLQKQHPWNHGIRKLSIALCLQQKDYSSAMDAIETLVAFSRPDHGLIESALAVRNRLGPMAAVPCPQNGAVISLCMIARNEQAFLGPCLNAVKHMVDEIVLIDTGSTDRTADIGRIYGARVFDFQWCEDFSAARNASLEKAQGDWILILDADEIIAPQDHGPLRALIDQADTAGKAFTLQTRNYTHLANTMDWQANEGQYREQEAGIGWFPTDKVRLFKRNRRIRFVYPVHELVEPSVQAAGMTIEPCPIPIHHYGHLNETRNAQKARQYFDLGYTKLEQLSGNRVALRELAIQAGQLEKWSEAIALWERFLKLSPESGEAYANMAGACWQLEAYDQGISFSRRAIEVDPDLKEGHYNLAANLIMNGQAGEAARILNGVLLRHPEYLAAAFMLGAALSLDGDLKRSRSIFKDLEAEISSQALAVAVSELVGKFKRNAMSENARQLLTAADIHFADQSKSGDPI